MVKHSTLRFILVTLLLMVTLFTVTACDDSGKNPTPPPATIISASEKDEPTVAPAEPPATATPVPEPPTRPPEPTAEPEGTPEGYPAPPTPVPEPTMDYPTPSS